MKRTIMLYLVIFIIGNAAGIGLFSLFCPGNDAEPLVEVEPPAMVTERVATTERHYKGIVDSLASVNVSLEAKDSYTETLLRQAKRKQRTLEQKSQELVHAQSSTKDTAVLLDNFDSLAVVALDLLDLHRATDSLHEIVVHNMRLQLDNKDSIIQVQYKQYDTLKTTLNNTLLQQQALIQANEKCLRQLKKQRRGKKLITALLFIGAGVAISSAMQ